MKTFATPPRAEPSRLRSCPLCGGASMRGLWAFEGFSFVRCATCGLVQQNPQPLREAVLARYDESYLAYEAERHFVYAALERRTFDDLGLLPWMRARASAAGAVGPRPRFLDVGCATGALLASFKEEGWDLIGLDACKPAVLHGRERFGLDLREGVLEEAGLEAGSFDLVHASHLIEHLNEPRDFLAEALGLLAPEGRLLLTTPNIGGFQARLLGSGWRSAINDHLYLFSKKTLAALIEASGGSILASVTWGGWAAGLRPAFIKGPLDRAAKLVGQGDVMALLCRRAA